MAATAGGVAIGSAVGHSIGHMMTGGNSGAEQPQQYQGQPGQPETVRRKEKTLLGLRKGLTLISFHLLQKDLLIPSWEGIS